MKIIIAGGGKVGSVLCEELSTGENDIILIEKDETRLENLINMNDRLEQMGLQKHKKALVKACYIPNYNNIEFTMICDL